MNGILKMNPTNLDRDMTKRLLLCDDEIHILRAVEFKLAGAGYEVRCAQNGREAWQSIGEQIPEMVITDLQMPEMNGFELIQKIRENPATSHLPIIMLTAKGLELDKEAVERCGLVTILTKPFSPRELLRLVDDTLGSATLPTAI